MHIDELLQRALQFEFLSKEEGLHLFSHAPLADLMNVADELRKIQVPHGKVTWQIDRNVNTTYASRIANFVISIEFLDIRKPTSQTSIPIAKK